MSQNSIDPRNDAHPAVLRLVTTGAGLSAMPAPPSPARRSGSATGGIALTADTTFAADSDELDSIATGSLDRLAAFLIKYRSRTGLVEGYTDSTGVDPGNQDLPLRRAETVKCYLVAYGIDGSRLVSIGRGSTCPIASNESVAGRQQNRRVMVLIGNGHGSANQAANRPLDHASEPEQLDARK